MSDEVSERIESRLDGMMARIHNLYDISKALPHPYDAYNDLTNSFLHDFAGLAFMVKSRIGRLELDLADAQRELAQAKKDLQNERQDAVDRHG